MRVVEQIRQKLTEAFAPTLLEVVDQSHLHSGHAGAPEGGESHFRVRMIAEIFATQSRLARQRAVNSVLSEELAGPVHALSLQLSAPDESIG